MRTIQVNSLRAHEQVGQYRTGLTARDAAQRLGPDAMAVLAQHTRHRIAQLRAALDSADADTLPVTTRADWLTHEAPALVLA